MVSVNDYPHFDYAIMAVFVRLVFDISEFYGDQRLKLQRSDYWSGRSGDVDNKKRLHNGMKAFYQAYLQAICISLAVVIATAIGISIPARTLEERMKWIMTGLMFLFAAVVLGMLSFQVAFWTGVYHIVYEAPEEEMARTHKELQFGAHCGIYRIFARYFFFLMPFYQGVSAINIPLSMFTGILAGLIIDYGVYIARRRPSRVQKFAKYFFMALVVFFSSLFASYAAWYIIKVFEDNEKLQDVSLHDKDVWLLVVFFLSFFGLSILHLFWYKYCIKQLNGQKPLHMEGLAPNRPRMAASLFFSERNVPDVSVIEEFLISIRELDVIQEDEEDDAIQEDEEEDQGSSTQEAQLAATQEYSDDENINPKEDSDDENIKPNDEQDEDKKVPSYRDLIIGSCKCCGCVRGDERSRLEKVRSCFWWTVWLVLVGFSLWLTIVNLGATVQQDAAREKLPTVKDELYVNINAGPVCAVRGPHSNITTDSTITTFESKEAAHEEGFLVLHCGACAACSDWHNLRLEYTTRNCLAEESAKCARESLLGGRKAVLECLEKPEPIGFRGKCAECWVDDILCTKGFCAFIFLQSTMIDTVSNFEVVPDMITSAACEEAHCEAGDPEANPPRDFVYCSGATRRRMNVTSTIARPGAQRCGIVDVDWAQVFPS